MTQPGHPRSAESGSGYRRAMDAQALELKLKESSKKATARREASSRACYHAKLILLPWIILLTNASMPCTFTPRSRHSKSDGVIRLPLLRSSWPTLDPSLSRRSPSHLGSEGRLTTPHVFLCLGECSKHRSSSAISKSGNHGRLSEVRAAHAAYTSGLDVSSPRLRRWHNRHRAKADKGDNVAASNWPTAIMHRTQS